MSVIEFQEQKDKQALSENTTHGLSVRALLQDVINKIDSGEVNLKYASLAAYDEDGDLIHCFTASCFGHVAAGLLMTAANMKM